MRSFNFTARILFALKQYLFYFKTKVDNEFELQLISNSNLLRDPHDLGTF